MDKIKDWLDKLIKLWKARDVDSVVLLFDKYCETFDTPFSIAGDVYSDWQEIKTQNIKNINYKILMIQDYECVVEFIINYDNEICSAINHLKFNNDYKCIYLKQWYMTKYL